MVSPDAYIPVLKLKQGEAKGLSHVKDRLSQTTPLFEITPNQDDEDTSRQVEKALGTAMKGWEDTRPFFLDAWAIDGTYAPQPESNALAYLANNAGDTSFIPVTGLRRSEPYQNAATHAADKMEHGMALRITQADVAALVEGVRHGRAEGRGCIGAGGP
jgi:hypothetical protein